MTKGTASPLNSVPLSRKAIPMPTRMPRKYRPTMTSAAYSGKKVTANRL